jgi:hypothetical protein
MGGIGGAGGPSTLVGGGVLFGWVVASPKNPPLAGAGVGVLAGWVVASPKNPSVFAGGEVPPTGGVVVEPVAAWGLLAGAVSGLAGGGAGLVIGAGLVGDGWGVAGARSLEGGACMHRRPVARTEESTIGATLSQVRRLWYAGCVTKWISTLLLVLGACSGSGKEAAPVGKEPMTAPYMTIQETLADDSIDELPKLSARVITAAEPVQGQPGVADVIAGAGRVAAQDIETARVAFEKVSMGMITYLKKHPEEREGLEVIHCTMAFNNKGAYWVQKAGKVINPYHGKMMLHCGDKVAWDQAPG